MFFVYKTAEGSFWHVCKHFLLYFVKTYDLLQSVNVALLLLIS